MIAFGICPACESERPLTAAGRLCFHLTRHADDCLDECDGVGLEPLPKRGAPPDIAVEPKKPRKPHTPYAGPQAPPAEVRAAVLAMLRPDELFAGDPVVGAIKALADRLGVNYGGLRTAMSSGTTVKRLDRLRALHAALGEVS